MKTEIQRSIQDLLQMRHDLSALDVSDYCMSKQILNLNQDNDAIGSCTFSIAEMLYGGRSVFQDDLQRYAARDDAFYDEVLLQADLTFKLPDNQCDYLPLVQVGVSNKEHSNQATHEAFTKQLANVFNVLEQSVLKNFPDSIASIIKAIWPTFSDLFDTPIATKDLTKVILADLLLQDDDGKFYKIMDGSVSLRLIPTLVELLSKVKENIDRIQTLHEENTRLIEEAENLYINDGLKSFTSYTINVQPKLIQQLLLGLILSYFTNVHFMPQLAELQEVNSHHLLDIQDLQFCETSSKNFRNVDFEVFLSVYQGVLFNDRYEALSYKNLASGPYKPLLNDVKNVLYSNSGTRYKYDPGQRTYVLDEQIYTISNKVVNRTETAQEDDDQQGDEFSLEGSQSADFGAPEPGFTGVDQITQIGTFKSVYDVEDEQVVIREVKTTSLESLQQFFHPVYHSAANGQSISNELLSHNIRLENQRQEYRGHLKLLQLIRKQVLKRHRANKVGNQVNGECQRERKLLQDVESLKKKILGARDGRDGIRPRFKTKATALATAKAIDRGLDETEAAVAAITKQLDTGGEKTSPEDAQELRVPLRPQPDSFNGVLKQYQILGFSWLLHMFEQGLNPLLCDQMGLGKTVQVIAFFSALFDSGISGPFLVVCPNSLLSNWYNELTRFNDSLRVWPYWGSVQQRQSIKQALQLMIQCERLQNSQNGDQNGQITEQNSLDVTSNTLNLADSLSGCPGAPFHVLVTSYSLAVQDFPLLSRLEWISMVLDEGQMIKSSETRRWKALMKFRARNKILLSGTPIQNSLDELWSLLHFTSPDLFTSKDLFVKWFGGGSMNDMGRGSDGGVDGTGVGRLASLKLNQAQMERLNGILRPFLLRREKKDVANQLGMKKEAVIRCEMTKRQKQMYLDVQKGAKSFSELKDLQNTLMQLRKVINHPQLFGRNLVRAPFRFTVDERSIVRGTYEEINLNEVENDDFDLFEPQESLQSSIQTKNVIKIKEKSVNEQQLSQIIEQLYNMYFFDSVCQQREAFLRNNVFPSYFTRPTFEFEIPQVFKEIFDDNQRKICHKIIIDVFSSLENIASLYKVSIDQIKTVLSILVNVINPLQSTIQGTVLSGHSHYLSYLREYLKDIGIVKQQLFGSANNLDCWHCGDIQNCMVNNFVEDVKKSYKSDKFLYYIDAAISSPPVVYYKQQNNINLNKFVQNVINQSKIAENDHRIYFGGLEMLLNQSGKLIALNNLLDKILFGHQTCSHKPSCLIYAQMTKMLDILEQYLAYKRISYVRLDGGMSVQDRKASVDKFMTDDSIQVFLLSTRAGSLGLNLTRANNVIFYESDWNPTSDQQASDRVHRIGQTRDVQIWKIITKNSVDELILNRATNKEIMQATVLDGQQRDQNGRLISIQNKKEHQKQLLLQFIGFQ